MEQREKPAEPVPEPRDEIDDWMEMQGAPVG